MRSRYAAYALGDVAYIMRTTHPEGPHYRGNEAQWRQDIVAFCRATQFLALDVLSASGDEVVFRAVLQQGGKDASFTERSTFARYQGGWMYLSGEPG